MSNTWGGKRPGAGRPRQYVRIPMKFYTERSEREPLTSESDLSICLAEIEVDEGDTRRGIVLGDIWYSAHEAAALVRFIEASRRWLETGIE